MATCIFLEVSFDRQVAKFDELNQSFLSLLWSRELVLGTNLWEQSHYCEVVRVRNNHVTDKPL